MVRHPYRVAWRLCGILITRWREIEAHYYQVEILRLRPSKILGLAYTWAVERVPHDQVEQWITDLNDLLPWEDPDGEAAEEIESESFMALHNRTGG